MTDRGRSIVIGKLPANGNLLLDPNNKNQWIIFIGIQKRTKKMKNNQINSFNYSRIVIQFSFGLDNETAYPNKWREFYVANVGWSYTYQFCISKHVRLIAFFCKNIRNTEWVIQESEKWNVFICLLFFR